MHWLRDFFFGNWRNKGVALFFSVIIWTVAYYSEEQPYPQVVRVELKSTDESAEEGASIITSVKQVDKQTGDVLDFDGRVRLLFRGPRKQVDEIKDNPLPFFPPNSRILRLSRDQESYTFTQDAFNFPRGGVQIAEFAPETLRVTQEALVTREVVNLEDLVQVSDLLEGYEVLAKEVKEDKVTVTGPLSIIGKSESDAAFGLGLQFSMEFRERLQRYVELRITPRPSPAYPEGPPAALLSRTVRLSRPGVTVTVTTQAARSALAVDQVKLSFRIPPPEDQPIRIKLDNIVDGQIPLVFHGRKDEIERLDKLVRNPGFSVVVPVPSFNEKEETLHTFTENDLELYGFRGVEIRQHESRKVEGRGAWTYRIIPAKEEEGK